MRPVPVLAVVVVLVMTFFAGSLAVLVALLLLPVWAVARVVAYQRSQRTQSSSQGNTGGRLACEDW
jgi:ABC-type transport system involved in cytochrome bd biosynthesis fused ATPase/permease subunit